MRSGQEEVSLSNSLCSLCRMNNPGGKEIKEEIRQYTAEDMVRVAQRVNNPKRSFLFVNPLQAKHIPVSPTESLRMMHALGALVKDRFADTVLVIGFAETATAIGACVAAAFERDLVYVQTTREQDDLQHDWLSFSEVHSHAPAQRLCIDKLGEALEKGGTVILVDDEISTGRTCLDLVRHLRERFDTGGCRFVLASLLSSCSKEDEERLRKENVELVSLAQIPSEAQRQDFSDSEVHEAGFIESNAGECEALIEWRTRSIPNPRFGIDIQTYMAETNSTCRFLAEGVLSGKAFCQCRSCLVLGTEECMYPALCLGAALEHKCGLTVRCHATTRSPIGISEAEGYPIRSGRKLKSFYDPERTTYLYSLAPYDMIVVVTDSREDMQVPMDSIVQAFTPYGVSRFARVSI